MLFKFANIHLFYDNGQAFSVCLWHRPTPVVSLYLLEFEGLGVGVRVVGKAVDVDEDES